MKVFVLNCADTGNFGDDIIFEGVKNRIKIQFPEHKEIISIKRINKEIAQIISEDDYLIIGGGELLSSSDILKQITSNDIRCRYEFYSIGVGSESDIKPYIDKLKPAVWSGRTKEDCRILNNAGIKGVLHKADPLFDCGIKFREKTDLIGINFKNINKNNDFIRDAAFQLDKLLEKGIKAELIALNCRSREVIKYYGEDIYISDCNDLELMYKISNLMVNKINIVYYKNNPLEFLSVLSRYRGIIAERLHCIMSAFYCGIDFRAISYHKKIDKFLEDHDLKSKKIKGVRNGLSNIVNELNNLKKRGSGNLKGENRDENLA